jgi:NAD(P)-dependent dehydrogenase (short-subunit alcohol dehydrogenase family)
MWSLSAIPGFSGYSASKAAATKIHEYLQAENPGLHVVNVHRGVVDMDMGPKSGFVGMDDGESLRPCLVLIFK